MSAIQKFATDAVPVGSRLDYWNELVDMVYSGTYVDAPANDFRGSMAAWSVGELDMLRPASTNSKVGRKPRPIDDQRLILHLQCRGTSSHRQGGRNCDIGPGGFVITSPHEAYEITLAPHEMLIVEFPRSILEERFPRHEDLLIRGIRGSLPASRTLHDFLLSLWRQGEAGLTDPAWERVMNGVFYDMLVLALEGAERGDAPALDRSLQRELFTFIEANLRDPDLKTGSLADAFSTSSRTIQNCFSAIGTTPSAFILKKRLERAADHLLTDSEATITDVAFEYGFNDSAYFSRCFRQQFGAAPREWRLRH